MLRQFFTAAAMVAVVSADTWQVADLRSHFMGPNNGQEWPVNKQFDSTLNFTLEYTPDQQNASDFRVSECFSTWKNGTRPDQWFGCVETRAKWRFAPSAHWTEGNFTLEILFTDLDVGKSETKAALTVLTGNVSSNSAADNSYLTCSRLSDSDTYAGGSCISGGKQSKSSIIPLTVGGVSEQVLSPFKITGVSGYDPSDRPDQACLPRLQFNVFDPNDPSNTTLCSKTWECSNQSNGQLPVALLQHVECNEKSWWFSATGTWSKFKLDIHREHGPYSNFAIDGGNVSSTVSGKVTIQEPEQLTSTHAASGASFWGLKSGVIVPVAIGSVDYH